MYGFEKESGGENALGKINTAHKRVSESNALVCVCGERGAYGLTDDSIAGLDDRAHDKKLDFGSARFEFGMHISSESFRYGSHIPHQPT